MKVATSPLKGTSAATPLRGPGRANGGPPLTAKEAKPGYDKRRHGTYANTGAAPPSCERAPNIGINLLFHNSRAALSRCSPRLDHSALLPGQGEAGHHLAVTAFKVAARPTATLGDVDR